MPPRPLPPLVPRPVAGSIEELLEGAGQREPFSTSDSKSGSAFERVVIDGEAHVVKHIHVDDDWTMRFNGDVGCHPLQVWAAGLMDVLPERIDHGMVGAAAGLGRNGWGAALLMRDLGGELVPPGDEPLPPEHHERFIDDMAALSARMLGWRDDGSLVPMANRWNWFVPADLEVEAERGWPDPVPLIAAEGWAKFPGRVSPTTADVIEDLRADAGPLVAALAGTPLAFIHGDWKLGNVGAGHDGRTVLIDWTYPGEAPPCWDLAWYLCINQARLPESKDETIERFRTALARHGAGPDEWFDQQMAVCLLAGLVVFGWEKALGTDEELAWWCERAAAGAERL